MTENTYLAHHGILGQKWGVRRYQNKDGTLTEAGKKRYDRYLNNMRERTISMQDTIPSDVTKRIAERAKKSVQEQNAELAEIKRINDAHNALDIVSDEDDDTFTKFIQDIEYGSGSWYDSTAATAGRAITLAEHKLNHELQRVGKMPINKLIADRKYLRYVNTLEIGKTRLSAIDYGAFAKAVSTQPGFYGGYEESINDTRTALRDIGFSGTPEQIEMLRNMHLIVWD